MVKVFCLSFVGLGFGHVSVSYVGFVFRIKTINETYRIQSLFS